MTVTYSKMNLDEINPYQVDQVTMLVVELAKELNLPWDYAPIARKVEDCIKHKVGELYCMIDGERIVGIMGFVYTPELWNDEICATEIVWYVLPSYRGRAGIYLIKEVEKNIEADRIRVGVGNIQLVKMLERLGWVQTKYIVEKDLCHGSTSNRVNSVISSGPGPG